MFKMNLKIVLILGLSAFFSSLLFSQNKYEILLDSGNFIPEENINSVVKTMTIGPEDSYGDYFYRFLQFNKIPTVQEHARIAAAGIKLMDYLPHLAYAAAIPNNIDPELLLNFNIRSVWDITADFKIAKNLKGASFGSWADRKDKVEVLLQHYNNIKPSELAEQFERDNIQVELANGYNNTIKAQIKKSTIKEIAALPYVFHIELMPEPGTPEDNLGRSLHRSNTLDANYAGGRTYTGAGVGVLVRDDGGVGPHIDFHGRLHQELVGDQSGGTHGDGVAGIMTGSGNFDITKRGMAAGSELYVLDYEETYLDETLYLFFDNGVLVTNSSYSNGCNAGYTSVTQTVDQQIAQNPTLLHVFSAGNSNNNDCGYGAGTQWGNITGGHKQGKNVIATANVFADGNIVESSSRGPAYDGRIKPDIAANGQDQISTDPNNSYEPFGGTSGAAPGIAGVTAQLHEAYAVANSGETAESALLKGILLNSATDLGNPGPDFTFGWGLVNAYRAVRTIEDEHYFSATLDPGATAIHEIIIPENVKQAKIMVYWNDHEAMAGAGVALQNNFDITITDLGSNELLPWILDPTPNASTLNDPATKGVDALNNMEQVAIENPAAGTYSLNVTGTSLPFGNHKYYVIYEFQTEVVKLTYPIGGESFVPGEAERIHWDAYGSDDVFKLEYSTDGGNSWSTISTVDATDRIYDWEIPSDFTGHAKVRVNRGAYSSESEANFSIAPLPVGLKIISACPTGINLEWEELSGAESYDIYTLGAKYMEITVSTSELTAFIPFGSPSLLDETHYFAIVAHGPDGSKSRRTVALEFKGGFFNCSLPIDVAAVNITSYTEDFIFSCEELFAKPIVLRIENVGQNPVSDIIAKYRIGTDPTVSEEVNETLASGQSIEFTFTELPSISISGDYTITSWLELPEDMYSPNDSTAVSFELDHIQSMIANLDVVEEFSLNLFPPEDWLLVNEDEDLSFEPTSDIQSDGTEGAMTFVDNYAYSSALNTIIEDKLFTVPLDLTNAIEPSFSFDYAYTYYQSGTTVYVDGLRVEVIDACGSNEPVVLLEKFGNELKTVPETNSRFNPQGADDWKTETFDLSDFVGGKIVIVFTNISGYGNNMYIDNINIVGEIAPTSSFDISSEPCVMNDVIFQDNSNGGSIAEYLWDFGSTATPSSSTTSGNQTVTFSEAGTVTVTLTVTNTFGSDTFTMDYEVGEQPNATFDYMIDDSEVTFTSGTVGFNPTYSWTFGDGSTSTMENPVHSYTSSGDFTVTLEVTNNCGASTFSQELAIVIASINELEKALSLSVYPNPSKGNFTIDIGSTQSTTLDWSLVNLHGQKIMTGQQSVIAGSNQFSIDATDLAAGVYFAHFQNELGIKTVKVIVQ